MIFLVLSVSPKSVESFRVYMFSKQKNINFRVQPEHEISKFAIKIINLSLAFTECQNILKSFNQ